MTTPNTITLSTTAIFSIAAMMLGYHLSAIFGFSLPLDLTEPQGSFEDSVISIVVNVLLLLTVGLRVGATVALSCQRALNVFFDYIYTPVYPYDVTIVAVRCVVFASRSAG